MKALFIISFLCCTFGCVKRTISITSKPAGAIVWLNDREIGRTPTVTDFTYYGEYDVRAELHGYQPIMTTMWLSAPSWDVPPIDLVTEIVAPNAHADLHWSFTLEPLEVDPSALIERAETLRNHKK
tara:strand:- start:130 stop:507 length:378 start_codon:yes stop_codon:yes gene_type:complete